jgi:4-nitrophenyl phosphatase
MSDAEGLRSVRAFIFDMDGVLYRGKTVLSGAPELFARFRREKIPYLFLTNNSTTPPQEVADRLQSMGIAAAANEVLTSAEATAAFLAGEMPGARVLVIGETGIRLALTAAGFVLTADHKLADAVVVGMDREATYTRLKEASLAIQRGAWFLATNLDASLPSEEGLIPGAGSLVGMLEIASGIKAQAIGKPEAGIFRQALARLGVTQKITAAVGDRPETDILGGQAAGLKTIAVLTGVGQREDFAAMRPPPDWVFEDLRELSRAYFEKEGDAD